MSEENVDQFSGPHGQKTPNNLGALRGITVEEKSPRTETGPVIFNQFMRIGPTQSNFTIATSPIKTKVT